MSVKPHFPVSPRWQALIVVLAAVLSYGGVLGLQKGAVRDTESAAPLQKMPQAYFYDATGEKVTLDDFAGQVVLVNLWATWCPPCVVELPSLDTLQAKMKGRPFTVVAIAMDRSGPAAVQTFLSGRGIDYLDVYWDQDRQIPLKWSYAGLPSSFLIDRHGYVVRRFDGPYEWHKGDIFEMIEALTKG